MELTTDRLLYIVDNWAGKTAKQMAEELGVSEATISYWGTRYREMGGVLPRKARLRNTQLEDTIAKLIITKGGTPVDPRTKEAYVLNS